MTHVCSIIPPHIFQEIAQNGDAEQRARAHEMLEQSSEVRGERKAFGLLGEALAVSTGEKRRTIYDAQSKRDLPGKLVRGEGDKASADPAVNEAYDGSGTTYDFYSAVLGRNSIDGKGLRLDSSVHFGEKYANAQWNGRQMLYGDGDGRLFNRFTVALDIIAHELTHGVTQYSSALVYRDQSGALNEHFSDVFGILVKQFRLKLSASKSDWLIGKGLFTNEVHGVAVRSMKAPGTAYDDKVVGKDPQPAHMKDYVTTTADNGGVHVNSGIPNKAFYNVATILGGNAWEVAGKIWYDTLTRKVQSNADFQACADATYQSAGDLFGIGNSPQHAVVEGWKAVGIAISKQVLISGPRIPVMPKTVPAKQMPAFQVPAAAAELPMDSSRAKRTRKR